MKNRLLALVFLVLFVILAFASCGKSVSFKLNFVVDGEVYATIDTTGNEVIKMPDDPTKEEDSFDGWYWDKGIWQKPFTANSLLDAPLSSNMSVYAKWKSDVIGVNVPGFDVEGNALSITVSNETSLFSFNDRINVGEDSTWQISTDVSGIQTIPSKTVSLQDGDNTFYLIITTGNRVDLYTVTVHRRFVYTVSFFSTQSDSRPIATVSVEEGGLAVPPDATPDQDYYSFLQWDFDFSAPITGDTAVYAAWEPDTFTISYDLRGGTLTQNPNPTSYTVESDGIVFAGKPYKENYTFTGWTPSTIRRGSHGALTVTANWTPTEYPIVYKLNGGTNAIENPATYTVEDTVTLAAPTRRGYSFDGWSDRGSISLGSTGEKTFVANWTVIVYPIVYDLHGGLNVADNPATYTVEDEISLAEPTRIGYSFAGWSNSGTIERGSVGERTFSADWTVNSYTISYLMNGGTNAETNPETYTIEDGVTLAEPTRIGYTFAGWSDNGMIALGSTGEKTFTANWTAINYQITYELEGGTLNVNPNPSSYTIETPTITITGTPKRDGYIFRGWSVQTIAKGSVGDKTVTAKWEPIVYTVTYNLNGGTNPTNNPKTYTIESNTYILSDASRIGYVFLGWTWDGQNEPQKKPVLPHGTIGEKVFTAIWSDPIVYSISYDLAEGTFEENPNPTEYTVESDTISLTGTPTRTGYTFMGWSVQTIAKGSYGDINVLAQWSPTVYTITYILNGGENPSRNPQTYTIESNTIIFSSPYRTGYDFTEWDIPSIPHGSYGNKTITANWDPIVYTISYNLGYGKLTENLNPTFYCIESDPITIVGDPTRAGYIFAGWSPATIETGSYGDVTVTAQWTAIFRVSGDTIIGVTSEGAQLTSLVIPNEIDGAVIARIGEKAFYKDRNLIDVTIEDGFTTIGKSAFGESGLVRIEIPESVTEIGLGAFDACYRISEIRNQSSLIISSVFFESKHTYQTGTSYVYFVDDFVFYDDGIDVFLAAYTGKSQSVVLPAYYNGKEYGIYKYAFWECKGLKSISIPDSIQYIYCTSFAWSNDLPYSEVDGVTYLAVDDNPYAVLINGSNSRGSVYVPETTLFICAKAFAYNDAPNNIIISDGVISIGCDAFNGCNSLTSITVPNSVRYIGEGAFSYCGRDGMTVYLKAGNEYYYSSGGCIVETASKTIIHANDGAAIPVDEGIRRIGKESFVGCDSDSVTIPDSVESIGAWAFNRRSNYTYNGTKEQWAQISKEEYWNGEKNNGYNGCTVHCTDGNVSESY